MAIAAIDVGGSKIAIRFITSEQNFEDILFFPEKSTLAKEKELIKDFLNKNINKIAEPFSCVGVSAAPTVNAKGFVTRWPNRPTWINFDIYNFLETLFRCPILIEDDGNAAALAEANAAGLKNIIYIGLGTGVSGGIIINQKIYKGLNGLGAELGHMIIGPGELSCSCGRQGCLQSHLSWSAIKQYAKIRSEKFCDVKQLRSELKYRKVEVRDFIEKITTPLIIAIINVVELLAPEAIIIGGRIFSEFPEIIQKLQEKIKLSQRLGQDTIVIKEAYFKEKASLVGAELLATIN